MRQLASGGILIGGRFSTPTWSVVPVVVNVLKGVNISDDDIVDLNIPTGVPLLYELDQDLRPQGHQYLGDPEEVLKAQVKDSGKTGNVGEKIVAGKIVRYFEENCLLDQTYIRDPKIKISDLLKSVVAKFGENIVIRRFIRYQLGEPIND